MDCVKEIKKKDTPFEEALNTVGEGWYTIYVAFVCGLASLAADCAMQSMYFILPSVSCEIELSHVEKALLGSVTFLGTVISSNFFGFLSDLHGRRKLLLISTFGTCIFSILMSISPNSYCLMITNGCTGLMLGGVFGLPFVYLSEFCCSRIRSKYITIASVLLMLANVYSPCITWLVSWLDYRFAITSGFVFSPWRQYIILNITPMLISAVMFIFLPESPKYLLFKGRKAEALKILRSCYKGNGTNKEDFPVQGLCLDIEDELETKRADKGGLIMFFMNMFAQLKEIFTPPHLLYTSICSLLMFGSIGLYSVVMLWIPDQASSMLRHLDVHGNEKVTLCEIMSQQNVTVTSEECKVDEQIFFVCIMIGLSSLILSVVVVFLVQKIKAKTILGTATLISSGICMSVVFWDSVYTTIICLGVIVTILGATLSLGVTFIVDYFPTSIRATATTVSLFFGRITVPIGSSLLGASFESRCFEAYSLIASFLAVIGVICFIIPSKKIKSDDLT